MEISKNSSSWKDKIFNDKFLSGMFGGLGVMNTLIGTIGICRTTPGSTEFIVSAGLICCAAASLWLSEAFDKNNPKNINKKQKYKLQL